MSSQRACVHVRLLHRCLVLGQKLTTGTWLEWGMQRFDNSVSRRSSVQSEDDLKKLNVMCCESCGYTIFPALGRTFRFDRFTCVAFHHLPYMYSTAAGRLFTKYPSLLLFLRNKCSSCGAVGSFFDKNDPDDERNLNPDGTSKIDERRTYMKVAPYIPCTPCILLNECTRTHFFLPHIGMDQRR